MTSLAVDELTEGSFRFFPSTPVLSPRRRCHDSQSNGHACPSPGTPRSDIPREGEGERAGGLNGGLENGAFQTDLETGQMSDWTRGPATVDDRTCSPLDSDSKQKNTAPGRKAQSREGGWGWVVTLGSFLVLFTVFGALQSFGVLYIRLLTHFRAGHAQTAWVGSLASGLFLLLGPLSGWLCDKLGYRVVTVVGACVTTAGYVMSAFAPNVYFLYFSYGVVVGCGFGLMLLPAIVIVTVYFERRRSLAVSLAGTGAGMGTLAIPLLTQGLLDHYGLTGTMLILGGVALQAAIGGALFRQPPRVVSPGKTDATGESSVLGQTNQSAASCGSIFRNPRFTIYVIATFFTMIGYFVPFVHLPDRAHSLGISATKSALLISILGVASMAGRVVFGWMADLRCTQRVVLLGMSSVVCGGATLLLPALHLYWLLLVYALLHGCFIGVWVSLQTVVMSDLVGVAVLNRAVGIMTFFHGLGAFLSSPIAGLLYDQTSDYVASFYVAGALFLGSGLLVSLLPCGGLPASMAAFSVYVSRRVSLASSRRASLDVTLDVTSFRPDVTTPSAKTSSRRASIDVISARRASRDPGGERRASIAVVSRGTVATQPSSRDSGACWEAETSRLNGVTSKTADGHDDIGHRQLENFPRRLRARAWGRARGLHVSRSTSDMPSLWESAWEADCGGSSERRASVDGSDPKCVTVSPSGDHGNNGHLPGDRPSGSKCITHL